MQMEPVNGYQVIPPLSSGGDAHDNEKDESDTESHTLCGSPFLLCAGISYGAACRVLLSGTTLPACSVSGFITVVAMINIF